MIPFDREKDGVASSPLMKNKIEVITGCFTNFRSHSSVNKHVFSQLTQSQSSLLNLPQIMHLTTTIHLDTEFVTTLLFYNLQWGVQFLFYIPYVNIYSWLDQEQEKIQMWYSLFQVNSKETIHLLECGASQWTK